MIRAFLGDATVRCAPAPCNRLECDLPGVVACCGVEDIVNVAIVGIDGAGKTSLAQALAESAREAGKQSVTVKSRRKTLGNQVWEALGLTKEAENALDVPALHASAFVTAMFLDMAADLRAARAKPQELVLWDRHLVCLAAYGAAMSLSPSFLKRLSTVSPRPHLILWLDVPPAVAQARLALRKSGGPAESLEYLSALRAGYATVLKDDPRVTRFDARKPAAALTAAAWSTVSGSLPQFVG